MKITDPPNGTAAAAMAVEDLLAQFSRRAQLAQAAELARRGHLAAAENLLGTLPREELGSPIALDLRARIRAQQGRLAEAAELWTQALQLVPGNGGALAGLDRIGRLQRRPVWFGVVWPVVVGAIVVLAVAFLVNKGIEELEAVRLIPLERPVAPARDIPVPRTSAATLLTKLQTSGVALRLEKDAVTAVFDSGLFARGAELTPSGAALLTEFGRTLESQSDLISVEVIGSTDDLPLAAGSRYSDNYGLGLARAAAAIEHLRGTTRLPERHLGMRSTGDSEGPFPNDSPANRARNRTVTLRIALLE